MKTWIIYDATNQPYSSYVCTLRSPKHAANVVELWRQRWTYSNGCPPPDGTYTARLYIQTALDNYGK
jgi:hypothetical protein